MIVYRLTKATFAPDLSGVGGILAAGRCNHKGVPAIYAAEHASLALAEILVHLDLEPDEVPPDYQLLTIEIPDHVPVKWAAPSVALAECVLPAAPVYIVPSVVVPQESNIVLYPHAPGFEAKVIHTEPFVLDERLLPTRLDNPRPTVFELKSNPQNFTLVMLLLAGFATGLAFSYWLNR